MCSKAVYRRPFGFSFSSNGSKETGDAILGKKQFTRFFTKSKKSNESALIILSHHYCLFASLKQDRERRELQTDPKTEALLLFIIEIRRETN